MTELTFQLIEDAAARLKGRAIVTPLLRSDVLDARVGGRVFLKCENLQHVGAFKFRGAYVALSRLTLEERARGVVAWSSGNHAQGVAAAAKAFDVPATIVMPHDAPATKHARTQALGAHVVGYERDAESREDIANALAAKSGASKIAPYDDVNVMSGQGTVGLEIVQQLADHGAIPDRVILPCGGGGLAAGVSTVLKRLHRDTKVMIAEPEGYDDTCRSLVSGVREQAVTGTRSLCDALMAPTPGALTFEVNRKTLSGGVAISDAQVMDAMRFAFHELKLVLEPGGAVALAALLSGLVDTKKACTVAILSGGNADPDLFSRVIASDNAQAKSASTAS